MTSSSGFSWRRLLAYGGLAALIGPPIGGFILWLATILIFVIGGSTGPNPPLSGIISVLFIMLIWSYPFGLIPALLAGVFFVLMQTPNQQSSTLASALGSAGLGILSGLLAALVSFVLLYIFSYPDFHNPSLSEKLPAGLSILGLCSAAGALCGYLLNRWLK